jgi:hypothetical protein
MKKKIFNKETIPARNGFAGPWISISKSGNITFSRDLIKSLKLDDWGGVIFIQDEDKPKDWYMELSKDASALRPRPEKNGTIKIQSAYIVKSMLSSLDLELATYKFKVASEPAEPNTYAIFTVAKEPIVRKSKKEVVQN